MTYIYKLIDPRTDEIRYVGKTETTLKKRYSVHLRDAKNGTEWYVSRWIRQLLSYDMLPVMEVIEECFEETWAEREIYWIAYGRQMGWRLTNLTDGGDGTSGWVASEKTKRNISEAKKGKKNTDEHNRRIGEAKIGNQYHRGHKHTNETLLKIGEAQRGKKHTDEHRRKNSEAHQGEKHPNAKLIEADVHGIRRMFCEGRKDKEIAEMYGVTAKTINMIRHGKAWAWLKELPPE